MRVKSSEVRHDDGEVAERVLLSSVIALFSCVLLLSALLVATSLSRRTTSYDRRSTRRNSHNSRTNSRTNSCGNSRCRGVVVGVFVLVKAAYSLAFTFGGLMLLCRLLARETSSIDVVVGNDTVSELLTTATGPLRRHLAEMQRHGGLS